MWTIPLYLYSSYIFLYSGITILNIHGMSIYNNDSITNFLNGNGLYSVNKSVVVLTADNFEKNVLHSENIWIVEFYNSWCGYCQRFAATWDSLALDLHLWKDKVNIAAIDCYNNKNIRICREFNIHFFPSIKYFHENYAPSLNDYGIDLNKGLHLYAQRTVIVERLQIEQQEGRAKILPDLLPFNFTIDQLFSTISNNVKFVFLTIGMSFKNVNAEVALDLHTIPELAIKLIDERNVTIVKFKNLNTGLYVIRRDDTNSSVNFITNPKDRITMRQAIIDYLEKNDPTIKIIAPVEMSLFTENWNDTVLPDFSSLAQQEYLKQLIMNVKQMGDGVFYVDLETTFNRQLQEVSAFKYIDRNQIVALLRYLSVLEKYSPFNSDIKALINNLYNHLSGVDGLKGSAFDKIITTALAKKQIFSGTLDWIGCKGSIEITRQYPCGLWTLFHYLSVNANGNHAPLEVLRAIHGYITNFFGCEDCKQHFQQMAEELLLFTSVTTLDDSVLWLWNAHNVVNKRLQNASNNDPAFPKVQFPVKDHCPDCREIDNEWNRKNVLVYLRKIYARNNLRYNETSSELLSKDDLDVTKPITIEQSSFFKTFDMSMCLVLYITSFVLIILLIRLFIKRGYRKKPYVHDLLGKV